MTVAFSLVTVTLSYFFQGIYDTYSKFFIWFIILIYLLKMVKYVSFRYSGLFKCLSSSPPGGIGCPQAYNVCEQRWLGTSPAKTTSGCCFALDVGRWGRPWRKLDAI